MLFDIFLVISQPCISLKVFAVHSIAYSIAAAQVSTTFIFIFIYIYISLKVFAFHRIFYRRCSGFKNFYILYFYFIFYILSVLRFQQLLYRPLPAPRCYHTEYLSRKPLPENTDFQIIFSRQMGRRTMECG